MLAHYEVALWSISLILLPLALGSLLTGSRAPEHGALSKYYAAEKYLMRVGDLFLLALCSTGMTKLALHFDVIDASRTDALEHANSVVFLSLLVAYGALWARAVCKVRRGASA